MQKKNIKRWIALFLSLAVLISNLTNMQIVKAADITGVNLVVNPGFDDGAYGWTLSSSGAGTSGGHFYLDGASSSDYFIEQDIKIPADGTYELSAGIASAGTNGKFGIRIKDGETLKQVAIEANTANPYPQYKLDGMQLLKGQVVTIYVTAANQWVNGDNFEFICTNQTGEADEEEPSYIFEGNMVGNPSFSTNEVWKFNSAGYASNNGHNGYGDRHFYVDPSGRVYQSVTVPYTGYYKAGLWVASAGTGAKFIVKNLSAQDVKEAAIATNTKYSEYNLEIWMNKGDTAEISVTGGSSWVNGDDISLVYNASRFENMVVNPEFSSDNAWDKAGDSAISNGQATLTGETDSISQSIYIPQNGAYYAEVTFKSAENAKLSFAGEESELVSGAKMIKVSAENLTTPGPVNIEITGKAEISKAEVRFDLAKMPNEAPVASGVQVSGDCTVDLVLEASYKFEDADGHSEGNSEYQWLISDKIDGEYKAIEGENGKNISIKADWEDKYMKFQVIPVDQYAKAGDAAISDAVGPVDLNLVKNPGFESNWSDWSGINISNTDAYAGLNRGIVNASGTASQTITVLRTSYYDLSAYIRYAGEDNGAVSVEDEAGNVIKEIKAEAGTGWNLVETHMIPLEKGQNIKLTLKGASDEAYDIDQISFKRDRSADIPSFTNVIAFTTTPNAFTTTIDRENKTINLKYYYGTDLSDVAVKEIVVSDGAEASIKEGDKLNLSNEKTFTVTGNDGDQEEWTIKAETKDKRVALESSNKLLEDGFNWAANKLDEFVMTGIKNGPINVPVANRAGETADYMPSYWAGYHDRTAFYTRDFVHQATGAQIAGLSEENYSMFEAFAKECTEARKWYTVWALNFDGSVYAMDYYNDSLFVREVPAQFELVEKAYKQYLWSGDKRYIENEDLWNFYTNVMTKYVDSHDGNGNKVAQEVGTGIFNGSCTYNERGVQLIESGDAIGSQYQATLAYAGMLKARGEDQESEKWYENAAELKKYFNDQWSVTDNPEDMESQYVSGWGPNGEKYSSFAKEASWFMPLKMITEPGERNNEYIDFILGKLGNGIGTSVDASYNIEAYTYIPDMLFLYNRSDDAWKWMKYIISVKDEPHERAIQGNNGDYPEVSFTIVSQTIEGMMGVEPDAGEGFVATSPRLPSDVPDVTAKYMQIGAYELDLTHTGNTESVLTNHNENDINWEARFYGDYDYIDVDGKLVKAEHKKINGEAVSYAETTVPGGSFVKAKAVAKEEAEKMLAAADVDEKIDAIGEVTLESEAAIKEARGAYDELSDEAKAYVTRLHILEQAEAKLEALKNHQEEIEQAAKEVENLIDSLGEITPDSKAAIKEARAAYDALSEEEKALVTNLDVLERAEKELEALEKDIDNVKTDDAASLWTNAAVLICSLGLIFVILEKRRRAQQ